MAKANARDNHVLVVIINQPEPVCARKPAVGQHLAWAIPMAVPREHMHTQLLVVFHDLRVRQATTRLFWMTIAW